MQAICQGLQNPVWQGIILTTKLTFGRDGGVTWRDEK